MCDDEISARGGSPGEPLSQLLNSVLGEPEIWVRWMTKEEADAVLHGREDLLVGDYEVEMGTNIAWLEQLAIVKLMAAGKIGQYDDVGFTVRIHVSPDDTMH